MKIGFNKIKIALLALILCVIPLLLSSCSEKKQDLLEKVQERGKILAGVKYDTKPFGYIDEDKALKGFDIDLMREIARRVLGDANAVEFKSVTSSSRILALQSGEVDMVAASMSITKRREHIVDFSEPYFMAGQAIMVPKGSPIRSLRDLNGRNVIIVLGSTSEENLRILAPKSRQIGFRTYTDAFSALKAGRGEALTTDDSILAGFLYDHPNFKILRERFTQEPYGLAFRKSQETVAFQDTINSALEEIKEDGTLEKIRKKWIVKIK